jgi:hypothetical protein
MSAQTILLIGIPDSGKTNYVGCLWEALRARKGQLVAPTAAERVKYVEDALEHLMQGRFAPRTEPGSEEHAEPFSIPVVDRADPNASPRRVVVPDVTGELWQKAVETCELPPDWMQALQDASGVLLFVRIGSDQNVTPLDWVASARLLTLHAKRIAAAAKAQAEAAGGEAVEADPPPEETPAPIIPTQVQLCELVRFLEHAARSSGEERPKRVAVLVSAWDRLDRTRRAAGPRAYLETEYPLFHGRLQSLSNLEVEVFGLSVVGGDFVDARFRKRYLDGDPKVAGYVVREQETGVERVEDLTLPVAWVLGDPSGAP